MYPELEQIEALFLKHLQQGLNETEQRELEAYLVRFPELRTLFAKLRKDPLLQKDIPVFSQFRKESPSTEGLSMPARTNFSGVRRLLRSPARFAAVFALLILSLAASVYLYRNLGGQHSASEADVSTRYGNDVRAGSDRAVLTLGDGRTIVLEQASRGVLASQADSKVIKENDGLLVYKADSGEKLSGKAVYNTISTPRGGKYEITLPDGTRAWLNAASSLRFPAEFGQDQRVVEVSGEVYFDVSEDQERPFRVRLRDSVTVEVLGTQFNVNAYEGEQVFNTTLASGKVKVTAFGQRVSLIPGQQARLSPFNRNIQVKDANLLAEISWKDGFFYFDDQPLDVIMKQVERWYNVEVDYRETIDTRFNILMLSRNVPVSKLLEMMELTGNVKFNIEGRRIIVMK